MQIVQIVPIVHDLVCTYAEMSENWVTTASLVSPSSNNKLITLITQKVDKGTIWGASPQKMQL